MAGDLSVVAAVQRDLAALGDDALAESALAASALELARQLDGDNSATSKSMCAKALAELLERLRAMAPPAVEADSIDELASKRTVRRTRATG